MCTKEFRRERSLEMLQEDSVRNLQYDSDIRVAQPARIDPISKSLSNKSLWAFAKISVQ